MHSVCIHGRSSRSYYIHVHDAEFKEEEHPRNKGGEFSSGGGGGKSSESASKPAVSRRDEEHVEHFISDTPGSALHAHAINKGLRNGSLTDNQKEVVRSIDKVINEQPPVSHDTVVYRGSTNQDLGNKKNTVGWEVGYSSTSKDFDTAFHYTGGGTSKNGAVYEIKIPKGTRGVLDASKYDKSYGGEEREIILARGSRFVIDRLSKRDGVKVIHVRMVAGMTPRL